MHARVQASAFGVLVVRLEKELGCLFIEGALGERHNEQATDDLQDVRDAMGGLPVALQGIDANLAGAGHVGVVDLGLEENLFPVSGGLLLTLGALKG